MHPPAVAQRSISKAVSLLALSTQPTLTDVSEVEPAPRPLGAAGGRPPPPPTRAVSILDHLDAGPFPLFSARTR